MEKEFRPSTLNERKEFYENEFNINKVKKWFSSNKMKLPQLCALDAGTETGIIINKKLKGQMLYFPFRELKRKIKQYVPEDIYYDRNIYENPDEILKNLKFNRFITQELVFDVDADNIKCNCPNKRKLCDLCINKTFNSAKRMQKQLKRYFRKIRLVYSGRGFHIHVFDKKAFSLTVQERVKFNKKFSKFPIDPWVSKGHIRLIRMPYSLNSLVSRKVIPIKTNKFNKEQAYPLFLRN